MSHSGEVYALVSWKELGFHWYTCSHCIGVYAAFVCLRVCYHHFQRACVGHWLYANKRGGEVLQETRYGPPRGELDPRSVRTEATGQAGGARLSLTVGPESSQGIKTLRVYGGSEFKGSWVRDSLSGCNLFRCQNLSYEPWTVEVSSWLTGKAMHHLQRVQLSSRRCGRHRMLVGSCAGGLSVRLRSEVPLAGQVTHCVPLGF